MEFHFSRTHLLRGSNKRETGAAAAAAGAVASVCAGADSGAYAATNGTFNGGSSTGGGGGGAGVRNNAAVAFNHLVGGEVGWIVVSALNRAGFLCCFC